MKLLRLLSPVLLVNTALAYAQPKDEIKHAAIVFTHVAVIDTASSAVEQDMTVVVSGDHITQVGKAADIKPPKDGEIVDRRGKFLTPGLWDMHVHTFKHNPRSTNTSYFPLFIANGVTGVRDMWTTGDDFSQVVQWRKGLADGSFLGPRYGAVAWMVDGPDPIFPNSDVVKTPEEATRLCRQSEGIRCRFCKGISEAASRRVFGYRG